MIRLILVILYITTLISASVCLINSKDHYYFPYRIHLITIALQPHPLYQFVSFVLVKYKNQSHSFKPLLRKYIMHTSLFKTSLYTRSLLANPPAALPQIPTLAELKERTASMPIPIPTTTSEQSRSSFGRSSMPKSLLPSYSNFPPPSYAPSSVKSWAKLNDDEVKHEVGMKGSKPYARERKVQFGMYLSFLSLK